MLTSDYTSNAICASMGLPGFDTDSALVSPAIALRLLLKPSFHPEVCITLTDDGGATVAKTVAAQRMVWRLPARGPVLTHCEDCTLAHGLVRSLADRFTESSDGVNGAGIVLDGMPVDTALFLAGNLVQRCTHNVAANGKYASFVAQAVVEIWAALRDTSCKNALAHVAAYAGLDLPLLPEPEPKPVIRTIVLGSAEDRAEILDALRKSKG